MPMLPTVANELPGQVTPDQQRAESTTLCSSEHHQAHLWRFNTHDIDASRWKTLGMSTLCFLKQWEEMAQ